MSGGTGSNSWRVLCNCMGSHVYFSPSLANQVWLGISRGRVLVGKLSKKEFSLWYARQSYEYSAESPGSICLIIFSIDPSLGFLYLRFFVRISVYFQLLVFLQHNCIRYYQHGVRSIGGIRQPVGPFSP